jgi:hypothetical protein
MYIQWTQEVIYLTTQGRCFEREEIFIHDALFHCHHPFLFKIFFWNYLIFFSENTAKVDTFMCKKITSESNWKFLHRKWLIYILLARTVRVLSSFLWTEKLFGIFSHHRRRLHFILRIRFRRLGGGCCHSRNISSVFVEKISTSECVFVNIEMVGPGSNTFLLPFCQFTAYLRVKVSFCFMPGASHHHKDDVGCTFMFLKDIYIYMDKTLMNVPSV